MRFWSLGASRHFRFETLGGRGHSVRFSYKANDSDTESSDGNAFLPLQCFYIPNCQLSHEELHKEVQIVENNLTGHQGSTFPCFSSQKPYLSHAILRRKYTLSRTLFCLLWPCLMLVGGVALVGLVKLTQWLGRLSSRAGSEAARCRGLADTEGVLYRLLQGSSPQSPTWYAAKATRPALDKVVLRNTKVWRLRLCPRHFFSAAWSKHRPSSDWQHERSKVKWRSGYDPKQDLHRYFSQKELFVKSWIFKRLIDLHSTKENHCNSSKLSVF